MALPSTGTISLNQVNVELGRPGNQQISLGESAVRALSGRSSGYSDMASLRGKSSLTVGISCSMQQTTGGGFNNVYDRGVFSIYRLPSSAPTPTSYQWDFVDYGGMLMMFGGSTSSTLTLQGPTYNSQDFNSTYDVLVKCTVVINGQSYYTESMYQYTAGIN